MSPKNTNVSIYQCKAHKLPGSDAKEVHKRVMEMYKPIKQRTKRKPYVRSAYFNNQKIFFDFFWSHLANKKSRKYRTTRLKYFPCALELIKQTRLNPTTKENPNKTTELLHRFIGKTADAELFYVQIKQHKRTGRKQLMSIFPDK